MTRHIRLAVALVAAAAALALITLQSGLLTRTDEPSTSRDAAPATIPAAVRAQRCRAVTTWQQTRAQADPDPLAALRQAPDLETARTRALRILDDQITAITPVLTELRQPGTPLNPTQRTTLETFGTQLTDTRARIATADATNPAAFANTLVYGLYKIATGAAELSGTACPPGT